MGNTPSKLHRHPSFREAGEGQRGVADRSRAPHHCPHKIADEMATLRCEFRIKHDDWGARKLLKVLQGRHPRRRDWPAPSTVADLLQREGLVRRPRRRRARTNHPGAPRMHTEAPNDLWTTDCKGEFRTGDGISCYPLTLVDLHARFRLDCHGRHSTQTRTAWPVFEAAFREYGLPVAMRTDNGPPFATTSMHGLSKRNVWWMRLGIPHQRITSATPFARRARPWARSSGSSTCFPSRDAQPDSRTVVTSNSGKAVIFELGRASLQFPSCLLESTCAGH